MKSNTDYSCDHFCADRRGNPLTLCQEQYDAIQKIWSQHNIPQTIARNMNQESNGGFLTIEWNHL